MADRHPHRRAPAPAHAPDQLILAAVERAARHDPRGDPAVPAWTILEHLALARRSGAARHVGARLVALREEGLLERARRHGAATWTLTPAGARRLRRARRAGTVPPLPESPQHRAWRCARAAAGREIERFRERVRERLRRAALLLEETTPPSSDAWLELAEGLQRDCRRLGSASYCLFEWAEPDDARADVDERDAPGDERLPERERARRRARRAGRRNVRLWEGNPGA